MLKITLLVISMISVAIGSESPLEKFTLGSCNKHNLPQLLWDKMLEEKPDMHLWLGDIIYGDTENMNLLASKYHAQNNVSGYKKFRKFVPVEGVWDDHDYGANNSGIDYPMKKESQQIFLDFMGVDQDSERRIREGIYYSKTWGPKGKQVKIIFLDTRYFREEVNRPDTDVLGEPQWQWFEEELNSSEAEINIIVSSYSIASYKIPRAESWARLPMARERMGKIINASKASGIIFLTGDRHFSGVQRKYIGYKRYYEFMASGMTHYLTNRIAQVYLKTRYIQTLFDKNYGLIEIDWNKAPVRMRFSARTIRGVEKVDYTLRLKNGVWKK